MPHPAGNNRTKHDSRLLKRLATYSAAAAATTAGAAGVDAAEVVYDPADVTISGTPGTMFRVTDGSTFAATSDFQNGSASFHILKTAGTGYMMVPDGGGMAGNAFGYGAFLLDGGDTVSGTLTFFTETYVPTRIASSYGYYPSLFTPGDRGFVGLKFDISGNIHYGWADITQTTDGDVIVHRFGYNDAAGESSTIVPEPASLVLLAMGAACMVPWRRRQSA